MKYSRPHAFVDLETTGGSSERHRVIEIAVIRVEPDGTRKTWSRLVNPGRPVSAWILELTGIEAEALAQAPTFEEIAWDAWNLMNGAVFVAHNARFDHAFLRQEYRRLDSEFRPETLCSVRVSRALFPEHRRHDLSSVAGRWGLSIPRRHRALDDARAVMDFFELASAAKPVQFRKVLKELTGPMNGIRKSRRLFRETDPAADAGSDSPVIQLLRDS